MIVLYGIFAVMVVSVIAFPFWALWQLVTVIREERNTDSGRDDSNLGGVE